MKKFISQHAWTASLFSLVTLAFPACQGTGGTEAAATPEAAAPTQETNAQDTQGLPWADDFISTDPNHLMLSLKYVTYENADQQPVISAETAKSVVHGINQLYTQCNIHFRVEEFLPAVPQNYGLDFSPSSMGDLDPIRTQFDTDQSIVVINTGEWNNAGGLGADGANAWTMMPGQTPSGAVIEGPVADNANIVAHEIGHYLNLDHVNDQGNLMNPVIYKNSTTLTAAQCEKVRAAAEGIRSGALRQPEPTA